MKNFTNILESLGSKASLQTMSVKSVISTMRKFGLSRELSTALTQKNLKQIEKLTHIKTMKCCFIMVPTETSTAVSNGLVTTSKQKYSFSTQGVA